MSDNSQQVSVSRVINAEADVIFEVLADPRRHGDFDGSGTVRSMRNGPERLEMGSKFGMNMKMGVPYIISNKVVEFEENRLIAWKHFGNHRWRYELVPKDDGTLVTETFDWSTSWFSKGIELVGYPTKHPPAMKKTLERLDELVTGR